MWHDSSMYALLPTLSEGRVFCKCGCGERTKISDRNSWKNGKQTAWKGQPVDFIRGHSSRVGLNARTDEQLQATEDRARIVRTQMLDELDTGISWGMCQCGCGDEAPKATYTHTTHGYVIDEPVLFINGHSWSGKARNEGPEFIEDENGCHIWQGACVYSGKERHPYGRKTYRGKKIMAHRFYWEKEHGPIPEGLEIDHLCKQTLCVNVLHLDVVDHVKNVRRGNHTKLTSDDVMCIRKLIERGISNRAIARMYHCTEGAIRGISSGRSWVKSSYSLLEANERA
jgi:hypothetical protein